jgi:hypothetical protein
MASVKVPTKQALADLTSDPTGPWTYGCEHELADWERLAGPPIGMKIDEQDFTMVNSNGIAVDPTGKHWHRGGEICTVPSADIHTQVQQLKHIKNYGRYEPAVNYRSNLHIHVRVPGLRSNLMMLKRVLAFNMTYLPEVLDILEPIPMPRPDQYTRIEAFAGAMRRYRRRGQSHHHLPNKLALEQLKVRTCKEFFLAGVPKRKDGTPMWGVAQRDAVDLKQLLQTDTVEFRHFPGTLSLDKLQACLEWCRDWMRMALSGAPGNLPALKVKAANFSERIPRFEPYNHDLEVKYRATVHDGTVPLADIIKYQNQISIGAFKGSPYYA